MSDSIKHECGIALIRLLKPLEYYKEIDPNFEFDLNDDAKKFYMQILSGNLSQDAEDYYLSEDLENNDFSNYV